MLALEMSSADAVVTLKVLLEATGAAKAMRFGLDMTVNEVVKEIRLKTSYPPRTSARSS